jgi:hypothetical protein
MMGSPINNSYVLKRRNVTPQKRKPLKKRLQLYLPEFSSGGLIGLMTTFALLTTAASAHFAPDTLLLLGLVNLLANGLVFSLRAAFWVRPLKTGAAAQSDEEAWIRRVLESRLRAQGLQSGALHRSISAIMELPEFTQGKVHFHPDPPKSPLWAAITTLGAFALCGFFPLAGYGAASLFSLPYLPSLFTSSLMVGLALAGISWINSFFPNTRPQRLMRENLLLCLGIAAFAVGLGYLINYIF